MSQKQTQGRMWDMSCEPRQDFFVDATSGTALLFSSGKQFFQVSIELHSKTKFKSTQVQHTKFNSTQVGSRDRTGQLLRKAMNAF